MRGRGWVACRPGGDEAALRHDMLIFSRNVLLLSLVISAIAAALLYASLQLLMVRPMRRMTQQIAEFAHNPEDGTAGVQISDRGDEMYKWTSSIMSGSTCFRYCSISL